MVMEDVMRVKIEKTVTEAIEEIKDKLWGEAALTTDTMLLALAALIIYDEEH